MLNVNIKTCTRVKESMKHFSLFLFMLLVRESMLMVCMRLYLQGVFGSGECVCVSLLMCTFLIVCVCVFFSYVDVAI